MKAKHEELSAVFVSTGRIPKLVEDMFTTMAGDLVGHNQTSQYGITKGEINGKEAYIIFVIHRDEEGEAESIGPLFTAIEPGSEVKIQEMVWRIPRTFYEDYDRVQTSDIHDEPAARQ